MLDRSPTALLHVGPCREPRKGQPQVCCALRNSPTIRPWQGVGQQWSWEVPSPQPFWCVQNTRLSTELLFCRWGKKDLCETNPCSTCTGKLSLLCTGMWNRRRHIQALMGKVQQGPTNKHPGCCFSQTSLSIS